jgi:MSHA pilin protein MshA
MVRNQKGFTIIELVVVIVILGILAAVAFPKFQDLSGDAQQAVVDGTAAAIKSAAVITYAKNQGSKASLTTILANTDYDTAKITVGSPCTSAISVSYTGSSPLKSRSVDISAYCQ